MSDIFLSFASVDRERIRPLVAALGATGWSVFWDRTIPTGKTWRQVIAQEIRSCRAVIVVWSQHSVESTWVQEEAEEGKRRQVLLPILLDQVDPPFGFGSIQAADLTRWDGSAEAPAFQSLAQDIARIPGMPEPTPQAAPPLEAGAPPVFSRQPDSITDSGGVETDVEVTKKRAKAIVQVFESGRPRNYVFLQALGDDLEYGYLFASLKRGDLGELIRAYCDVPGAKFATDLRPFLDRLASKDPALVNDQRFHKLLTSAAGEDPVMIKMQDRLFDRAFWEPAVMAANAIGLRTPLGIASIFDTIIHSGIRSHQQRKEETIKATDGTPVTGIDEKEWVRVYLEKRRDWLQNHRIAPIQATAYRAEELLRLAKEECWDLRPPLTIRGTQIRT